MVEYCIIKLPKCLKIGWKGSQTHALCILNWIWISSSFYNELTWESLKMKRRSERDKCGQNCKILAGHTIGSRDPVQSNKSTQRVSRLRMTQNSVIFKHFSKLIMQFSTIFNNKQFTTYNNINLCFFFFLFLCFCFLCFCFQFEVWLIWLIGERERKRKEHKTRELWAFIFLHARITFAKRKEWGERKK